MRSTANRKKLEAALAEKLRLDALQEKLDQTVLRVEQLRLERAKELADIRLQIEKNRIDKEVGCGVDQVTATGKMMDRRRSPEEAPVSTLDSLQPASNATYMPSHIFQHGHLFSILSYLDKYFH